MLTLSFQAPEEMNMRLESCAAMLDRSKAYLIRQAIGDYLEELEDYVQAKQYKAKYNPKQNILLDAVKQKYKLK